MSNDTTTTTTVEEAVASLRETASNAYKLARLADAGPVDADDSPGANFLRLVAGDVLERVTYMLEQGDDLAGVEWTDIAHEVADGCVPVYTYGMWQTFVDLAAWEEDLSKLGALVNDMTQNARVALYLIGERLALALLEEVREAAETDDEAEDDAAKAAKDVLAHRLTENRPFPDGTRAWVCSCGEQGTPYYFGDLIDYEWEVHTGKRKGPPPPQGP